MNRQKLIVFYTKKLFLYKSVKLYVWTLTFVIFPSGLKGVKKIKWVLGLISVIKTYSGANITAIYGNVFLVPV